MSNYIYEDKQIVYLDSYQVNSPEDSVYDGTENKFEPIVTDSQGYELEENQLDKNKVKYTVEYPSPDYISPGIKIVIINIIGTDTTHFSYIIDSEGIPATEYQVTREYTIIL